MHATGFASTGILPMLWLGCWGPGAPEGHEGDFRGAGGSTHWGQAQDSASTPCLHAQMAG